MTGQPVNDAEAHLGIGIRHQLEEAWDSSWIATVSESSRCMCHHGTGAVTEKSDESIDRFRQERALVPAELTQNVRRQFSMLGVRIHRQVLGHAKLGSRTAVVQDHDGLPGHLFVIRRQGYSDKLRRVPLVLRKAMLRISRHLEGAV